MLRHGDVTNENLSVESGYGIRRVRRFTISCHQSSRLAGQEFLRTANRCHLRKSY